MTAKKLRTKTKSPAKRRREAPPLVESRSSRDLDSQFDAVQTVLMDTVNTVEKVLGARHPHLATAYENLAASLRRVGRSRDAAKAEARALQIRNGLLTDSERGSRRFEDGRRAGWEAGPREGAPPGTGVTVVDVTGAARYLGVSAGTVYGLVRSGEIPHTRVGKSIRFRVWDLDRFLEERTTRRWERLDRRGRPPRL